MRKITVKEILLFLTKRFIFRFTS